MFLSDLSYAVSVWGAKPDSHRMRWWPPIVQCAPWALGPLGSHNVPALSLGSWRSLLADTMYPPWLQLWPWRSLTALIKSW